jgi:hypothetical protein
MESETGSGGGGADNGVAASPRSSMALSNAVVSSVVALPERGCKGRTGTSTDGA